MKFIRNMKSASVVSDITEVIAAGTEQHTARSGMDLKMAKLVMYSPNHPTSGIEDAFSSNFPDFIPASPDYVPASPGKIYSSSSNSSYGVVSIASPTLSLFHNDPFMKVIHAYYAKESPITTTKCFSSLGRSREVFQLTQVCGSRDAFPSLVVPLVHLSLPLVSLSFQPRTYNLSTLPFQDSVQIAENDLVVSHPWEIIVKIPANSKVCGSRDAFPSLVVPLVHLSLPLVSLSFQPRTYNLSTLPFRDSVQIAENDLVVKKFPENDLVVKKFPENDLSVDGPGEASIHIKATTTTGGSSNHQRQQQPPAAAATTGGSSNKVNSGGGNQSQQRSTVMTMIRVGPLISNRNSEDFLDGLLHSSKHCKHCCNPVTQRSIAHVVDVVTVMIIVYLEILGGHISRYGFDNIIPLEISRVNRILPLPPPSTAFT
ncbi:hypothetical protein Tco_1321067 [Tanacetum coccineum]